MVDTTMHHGIESGLRLPCAGGFASQDLGIALRSSAQIRRLRESPQYFLVTLQGGTDSLRKTSATSAQR